MGTQSVPERKKRAAKYSPIMVALITWTVTGKISDVERTFKKCAIPKIAEEIRHALIIPFFAQQDF